MSFSLKERTNKISPEEAKFALQRSGYLLESRVETILRGAEYFVEPNVFYIDPMTQKRREIDIVAHTRFELKRNIDYVADAELYTLAKSYFSEEKIVEEVPEKIVQEYKEIANILGDCQIELIIECINNPQPVTFIGNSSRNDDFLFNAKHSGLKTQKAVGRPHVIPTSVRNEIDNDLREFAISDFMLWTTLNPESSECFYTQYCSFKDKNAKNLSTQAMDWMAFHDDEHHDVFNALCTVVDQRQKYFSEEFKEQHDNFYFDFRLFYPILVVQNELWIASENSDHLDIQDLQHVNYIRAGSSFEGYHIDVVQEAYLPEYLNKVARKINEIQDLCSRCVILEKTGENIISLEKLFKGKFS